MNKAVPIILAVIISAVVFGGGGYWLGKNKSGDNCPLANRCSLDLLTATPTSLIPTGPVSSTADTTTTTTPTGVSKEGAVEKVKKLQEVKDYLARVPKGIVEFDHEDTAANAWVIHVYEIGADATATFNWYNVNKITGNTSATF